MNGTEQTRMEKPGFDAMIPATVRYDPALRPNAKLLYGEIRAMASREGYCWASNRYFAQLYGLTVKTISELIRDLARQGHIVVQVLRRADTNEVAQRRIWISRELCEKRNREEAAALESEGNPVPENGGSCEQTAAEGIPKNPEDFIGMNQTRENIPPLPPKGRKKEESVLAEAALERAGLPQPARQAMEEWLLYKAERRETYKPQGLRALLTRAGEAAKRYGGPAAARLIRDAMASNYRGIPWDKLDRPRRETPPRQEVEEW